MRRTRSIPDVHGRPTWRYYIGKDPCERYIFHGDYFDSFHFSAAEQIHNFKEIIEFKKTHHGQVILLIGNHETPYLPWGNTQTAGYQSVHAHEIGYILRENREHLQVCHIEDNIIFSHAGVSSTWLTQKGYTPDQDLQTFINELYLYKPKHFNFDGWDTYGDDKEQGPLWIRPHSLQEDAYQPEVYTQIVGHTKRDTIQKRGNLYFIDTMETSRELLTIEGDKITIQ